MKKSMLICGPLGTSSGYGAHARDLFHAFYNTDKYNIKVIDVPWGSTPRNALKRNNENDKKILDRLLDIRQGIKVQPDIYVDIRIPNEFQQIGKYNIGITAGIETDAVSPAWIEGCNKMDLIIVPSEHSKKGFLHSNYDKLHDLPNGEKQKVGELKLEKPIEVVFEGAYEDIYKPLKTSEMESEIFRFIDDKVSEHYAFLHVGQWVKGNYGEDRKDIGRMLKVFYETFANKEKQPAMILKSNGANYSILDREDTLDKINNIKKSFPKDWKLPNVYLLHGDLTNEEMNGLYNHPKVKSLVSFTHGEGFGRPLLEATMTGLPVIASNWSGHVDFLDTEDSLLLGGTLNQVPKSAVWKDIIIPESKWFTVNEQDCYKAFMYAFEKSDEMRRRSQSLMKKNRDKFTHKKMEELLIKVVDEKTSHISSQVNLKLPKLKKSDGDISPKLPELKLPKLEKV
tara:strand:+ start:1940 stop:3301 length:1362 start_codon:yes stop_codon:yes gene_type:complete